MQFIENGIILYPYISNNQLCYEVDYNLNIRQIVHDLPTPPNGKQWVCYDVDMDECQKQSTITVAITTVY